MMIHDYYWGFQRQSKECIIAPYQIFTKGIETFCVQVTNEHKLAEDHETKIKNLATIVAESL